MWALGLVGGVWWLQWYEVWWGGYVRDRNICISMFRPNCIITVLYVSWHQFKLEMVKIVSTRYGSTYAYTCMVKHYLIYQTKTITRRFAQTCTNKQGSTGSYSAPNTTSTTSRKAKNTPADFLSREYEPDVSELHSNKFTSVFKDEGLRTEAHMGDV